MNDEKYIVDVCTCKKLIKQKFIFLQTVDNLIFISLSRDMIIVFTLRQSQ